MKFNYLFLAFLPIVAFGQTQKASDRAYLHYMDSDYDKSFKEYSGLVKYDNAEDYYFLAVHYDYGHGVEKNKDEAIKYYRRAADNGYKIAQSELSEIYGYRDEYDNLYRYSRMYCTNTDYRRSHNNTDDNAKFNLYLCYKNGWGTRKNETLADLWLSFAAANDCYDAKEEYCKNHGLNIDDFDSDEADEQLESMCFNHLYEVAKPIVEGDSSLEAACFGLWNNLTVPMSYASNIIDIFYEYDLSTVAGAALYRNGIKAILEKYIQLKKTNPEQISSDYKIIMDSIEQKVSINSDDYEIVSDDDIAAWFEEQLILEMWKIDTILNGTTNRIGHTNNIEWVDLGLPSGTKWASHNITSDERNLFAWGEASIKDDYSLSNYIGDMTQPLLNAKTDVTTLQCGSGWSTPTAVDWYELDHYCKGEFDDNSGCIKYTSPNGNSILLPLYYDSEHEGCFYWTKSKNTHSFDLNSKPNEETAIAVRFYTDPLLAIDYLNVWRGCLIRPVLKIN